MKKTIRILSVLCLAAALSVSAMAAEGGNPKKGKYLFKKNCKSCHVEGAEGGKVTPLSKTMSQWDRFFKKNAEACIEHVDGKLSEQDVKDIHQFLYDHAVDSDQPQTCG